MTDQQRKAIHDIVEYLDIVRGSVRIVFKDDGDITVYPTPKIELSTDSPLAEKVETVYNVARIIKID